MRPGEAVRVGGIEEVLRPPVEQISEEEGVRGEDGASNKTRIATAGMEMGGEEMDEGTGAEVEQDGMEAEEGECKFSSDLHQSANDH